jgi:light-regulated signal transduction histidine kinase (bacteriophytochrome)
VQVLGVSLEFRFIGFAPDAAEFGEIGLLAPSSHELSIPWSALWAYYKKGAEREMVWNGNPERPTRREGSGLRMTARAAVCAAERTA